MAFQLTNILRDLATDAEQGRIYLPHEDLAQFGCSEAEFLERKENPRHHELVRFEAQRARAYYAKAQAALASLPSKERRALTVAEIMRAVLFPDPGTNRTSRSCGFRPAGPPIDLSSVGHCRRRVASLEILVTPDGRQSVIVLGAGPAGLTAAYRLALGGLRVTVLTPSARIGEHLRRESDPPASILGCHGATWALLDALGLRPDQPCFAEAQLEFLLPSGRVVRYPKTRFPTPIQQLLTIGRFSGLRAGERWKLLSWLEQLWEGSVELPVDLEQRTAESWLDSLSHSPSSRQTIWAPLARWLTGNDLHHLSADAFVMALKPFFLSHAADSRIWVPSQAWDRAFVQPVTDALAKAQATVCAGTRAVGFEYHDDRITGLRVNDGTSLQADWYVAAVPAAWADGFVAGAVA